MGHQNSDKELDQKEKKHNQETMKTFALLAIATSAQEDDKKVPPRHPLQRLNKLRTFAVEWCNDNLTEKQAENWTNKFNNNIDRFEARWARCGFYDDNLTHGGPKPARKRRDTEDDSVDEEGITIKYDKNNPIRGIKQITSGFRKWAERYLADNKDGKFCKNQPKTQVDRANNWNAKLVGVLAKNVQN